MIELLGKLADAAGQAHDPVDCPIESLESQAFAFCQEVYPHLLLSSVNRVPFRIWPIRARARARLRRRERLATILADYFDLGPAEPTRLIHDDHRMSAFLQRFLGAAERLVLVSSEIGGLSDGRAIGDVNLSVHFVGNDVSERGFAKAWRAVQQNMIHRLAASLGRAHRDAQLAHQRFLADVLLEALRAQRVVELRFFLTLRFGSDNSFSGHKHL